MHTRMYLPDTKFMVLQTNYGNKQYSTLNVNDLVGRYCAAYNPFDLLVKKLFRCFRKVSECVAEHTKSVRSCKNSWKNGQLAYCLLPSRLGIIQMNLASALAAPSVQPLYLSAEMFARTFAEKSQKIN